MIRLQIPINLIRVIVRNEEEFSDRDFFRKMSRKKRQNCRMSCYTMVDNHFTKFRPRSYLFQKVGILFAQQSALWMEISNENDSKNLLPPFLKYFFIIYRKVHWMMMALFDMTFEIATKGEISWKGIEAQRTKASSI